MLLSDIHSNLAAFHTVLEDARAPGGWDARWCLGDIVGYGPDPGLRFDPFTLVHGSPRDLIWEYLLTPMDALANFALLLTPHGLVEHSQVALAFRQGTEGERPHGQALASGETLALSAGRWIVNPGSVGQPRDGDPRAAYSRYHDADGSITGYRVAYDIPAVVMPRWGATGHEKPLMVRLWNHPPQAGPSTSSRHVASGDHCRRRVASGDRVSGYFHSSLSARLCPFLGS